MIYRPAGDRVLMDYEALWVHCGQPAMSTLRAKCTPVACDVATRRLLYDADDSAEVMAAIKRRAPHRRVGRSNLTKAGLIEHSDVNLDALHPGLARTVR